MLWAGSDSSSLPALCLRNKMRNEIIIRKTLDLMLMNVKSMEDLELVKYSVLDYEKQGYDMELYKLKVCEMRCKKEFENGYRN